MRKIFSLVLYCTFFGSYFSQAQSVDGVALEDIESTYIEITRRVKIFNSKIQLEVDFGQDRSKGRINDSQVMDENGRLMEFNSMGDALNFFDRLGYEYIDRGDDSKNQPLQYLLRRKKEEMDLANSPLRRDFE